MRHIVYLLFIGILAISPKPADGTPISDANPMAMPEVGSYKLRILSPTLLELTLVTTKDPDPALLTQWSFVSPSGVLSAPAPSQFVVT
ncbi:MAG: hypothetical protein JWN25_2383, partial [Verrucomicrobiales bacterium]|nr:hypothetical protein [Verrucomicrobiales bacterium]